MGRRGFCASFLAVSLLGACAGAGPGAFHAASADCGNSKDACLAKCTAGTPAQQRADSYCQVGSVVAAEEMVRQGPTGTASKPEILGLKYNVEYACRAGVSRACIALGGLDALIAEKDTSASAHSPPSSPRDAAQDAQQLGARADAARALAESALSLDGTDAGRQAAHQVANCNGSADDCTTVATGLIPTSKVGAFAGLARNLANRLPSGTNYSYVTSFEPQVEHAEQAAQVAMDEAHRILNNRAAEKQKVQAENDAVVAVTDECAADLNACKAKCDGGDGTRCAALAIQLWHAAKPSLSDAKTTAMKGCEDGVQVSCKLVAKINEQIQAAATQVESLWHEVTDVGDDLATKRFQIGMMAKLANRPHLVLELQEMKTITAAIPRERYCPARRTFIEATSAGEFQKRAAAHCKDEPPSARGLSGANVTLTDECKQAFTMACP